MKKPPRMQFLASSLACLAAQFCLTACGAQDTSYGERALIKMVSESSDFRSIVEHIRNPKTPRDKDEELIEHWVKGRKDPQVYFRITSRNYVYGQQGKFNEEAVLGGGPYVFLTVPQAAYGRSLYEIYADLGYDAEGVLRQRGQSMVGLVVQYQQDLKFSSERDGKGPLAGSDYYKYVYTPTWENSFTLFARLAESEDPNGVLPYLAFRGTSDRSMARFFPAERRTQIAVLPYAILRAAGGPDWQYRQLLENKMGMNSHFRGVGITENTLSPGNDRTGLPEYVGPNRKFSELASYAVIDLGRMEFKEVPSPPIKPKKAAPK